MYTEGFPHVRRWQWSHHDPPASSRQSRPATGESAHNHVCDAGNQSTTTPIQPIPILLHSGISKAGRTTQSYAKTQGTYVKSTVHATSRLEQTMENS